MPFPTSRCGFQIICSWWCNRGTASYCCKLCSSFRPHYWLSRNVSHLDAGEVHAEMYLFLELERRRQQARSRAVVDKCHSNFCGHNSESRQRCQRSRFQDRKLHNSWHILCLNLHLLEQLLLVVCYLYHGKVIWLCRAVVCLCFSSKFISVVPRNAFGPFCFSPSKLELLFNCSFLTVTCLY